MAIRMILVWQIRQLPLCLENKRNYRIIRQIEGLLNEIVSEAETDEDDEN